MAIGAIPWQTAFKRCLLHDWSDAFPDKQDEKAYQTAQQQALAPLFKTLCIITIIHYGFMVLAMNSSSLAPPALVKFGMYAFVLPVTLALPLVAFGRLERGRQVVVVLNAYAFAYLVMSVSVACKVSPNSFATNYCANFSTLSAAQSLYATLGPLFMLMVGRLHRGINFAVAILLVALLGWTLSRNSTSTWQTTAYMTGFYVWLTLLSYWIETVDREKHILRRALIVQVDATLRAQSGEVREAASKRHFVSYIFHELRVPMNTFGIGLGNLEEEGLFAHYDPAQQAVLDAIKSSFGMMESVLNDVLDFEKMQEGRFTLHSEPFDVNATAQATVTAFANVARDKGITLESSFEEGLSTRGGGWVLGDDIRYRQILNNYLSNALKFTNRGGTVTITTSLQKKEPENASQVASDQTVESSPPPTTVIVRTAVTDTGCGISPEHLEDLFKPYIQIESRLTQNGKGTGLGLAICKHIVELAGGRCGVDSTLGQGSRFWFELELPVANKRERDLVMSGIVAEGLTTSSSLPSALPCVNTSSASVNVATNKVVPAGQQQQLSVGSIPGPAQATSSSAQLLKGKSDRDMQGSVPSISAPAINSSHPATSAQSAIQQQQQPLSLITSSSSSLTTKLPRRGRSLHILSADDDPITRMLMSRLLSQMGHTVVLAHDGRHALSLLAQHNRPPGVPTRDEFGADVYFKPALPPSPPKSEEKEPVAVAPDDDTAAAGAAEQQLKPFEVILLDNQMPICTGEEAVRIITKTWKMDIVVIGITGNALREDQDRFLEAGARMVITKPLRREILRTALEELSMSLCCLNSIPRPGPGDLYQGAATLDDATDGILGAIHASVDADSEDTLNEEKTTMMSSWRALIRKKTVRLLRRNDHDRPREQVADRDIHLSTYNNVAKTMQTTYPSTDDTAIPSIGSTVDLRPLDHVVAVLDLDTIAQAKELTGSASIMPDAGDAANTDAEGSLYPDTLFAGARTMADANAGVLRAVDFALAKADSGASFPPEKAIKLRRIISNQRKAVVAREKSLHAAVKRGDSIGKDDITAYENAFGRAERLSKSAVVSKAANGKTVPDTRDETSGPQRQPLRQARSTDAADSSAPSEDTFPSSESGQKLSVGDRMGKAAADFNKYKNVVAGKGRLGIRKFLGLIRKTVPGVKPRAGAGTGKTKKP
ncbi:hypothetical protein HDU89_007601 [Geranomyces variabilis]|nr:hypothetical protein HDU89_007601 [Geranomyces variabilis]